MLSCRVTVSLAPQLARLSLHEHDTLHCSRSDRTIEMMLFSSALSMTRSEPDISTPRLLVIQHSTHRSSALICLHSFGHPLPLPAHPLSSSCLMCLDAARTSRVVDLAVDVRPQT